MQENVQPVLNIRVTSLGLLPDVVFGCRCSAAELCRARRYRLYAGLRGGQDSAQGYLVVNEGKVQGAYDKLPQDYEGWPRPVYAPCHCAGYTGFQGAGDGLSRGKGPDIARSVLLGHQGRRSVGNILSIMVLLKISLPVMWRENRFVCRDVLTQKGL